jgi:peptide chain release factor 3
VLPADAAAAREGDVWGHAVEETELLDATEADHDQERFLAGETTPVIFASAVSNFGVGALLDILVDLAPAPAGRPDADGAVRKLDDPFSAFVFKVQSGMDAAHRDRLAYIRICSGVFERGMVVTHAATGRPFATKYAQHVFGRERESVDVAWPGDVVGLVNANALSVGDTLYVDAKVAFPPLTTFAPEHFAVMRGRDTGKFKQFRRGVGQLGSEGVAQILRSDRRGDQAPVLAVVGPMQFEVAQHRMEQEFGAPVDLDRLSYSIAVRTDAASAPAVAAARGVEVLEREDGELLALFMDKWDLRSLQQRNPELTLEPLVAAQL